MKRIISALAALALGIGLSAVAIAAPASAHTGDLGVTAVCNTTTGNYDLTATLTIAQTGLAGTSKWKVGDSTFTGTPTSNAGLDRGPVASTGAGTITLGSFTLPGTTKGLGPWVYAFTSWTDQFTKGSDGQLLTALKGDCKVPEPTQVHPTATVTQACGTATVTFTNGTKYAFAGDIRVDNEAASHVNYYGLGDFYQIVNIPSYGQISKTFTFTEDSGDHTVAFRIGLGAEQDWYVPWQTITVGSDCLPPAPQTCTATGPAYTEDGFPAFTANGQEYKGGSGHALNWLVPTSGNLQGITSASYTIWAATGYQAAYRFVLNQNGSTGYASVSAEPYMNGWAAGQTGTFTIDQSTLVWNSKIASGPGSQSHPVTLAAMALLIPNNQLISQGIHLGSTAVDGQNTTVSAVTGCASFTVPPKPEQKVSYTEWNDTTQNCDSRDVTQTRDKTVINSTLIDNVWVDDAPIVTHESQTRPMTSDELTVCAGPQPKSKVTTTSKSVTDCKADTVTTTTTTSTVDSALNPETFVWEDQEPVVTTSTVITKATAKDCPVQLPLVGALPFTGSATGTIQASVIGGVVALILLLGGSGAVFFTRRRRSTN